MAKYAFSKLGLKLDTSVSTIDFKGHPIEVKKYLPMDTKLEMVTNIINNSVDDNGYYNEGRIQVYAAIEMMKYYTNLSFTEKQQEDSCKLYDLFVCNGLLSAVYGALDSSEYNLVMDILYKSIKAIYEYKNSAMGVMEALTTNYNNMDLDATAIQSKLNSAPESLALLKDIVTNLG